MLRSKEDVDRHAQLVFRKTNNELERKTRCLYIAQLYCKIKEYESVRQYVTAYLTVRHDSSPAHKLLAEAHEHLGQWAYALASYENSLKYDPNQPELLLKVCELYCHKDVSFNPEKVQSWLEKTKDFFPHEPVVFALKEKLIGSGDKVNKDEFEKLLLTEIKSRPSDLNIRTKLLKLYVDTARVEMAFNQSIDLDSRHMFNKSSWFECVDYICEAYKKDFPSKCNWDFYMHWLSALDRLCSIRLCELFTPPSGYGIDHVAYVHKFDRILFLASQLKNTSDFTNDFMSHMSAQLAFHLALLVVKQTKKDCSNWCDAKKTIGTLLLLSIKNGIASNTILSLSNLKAHQKKGCEIRAHHAGARFVQAGYTLLSLVKEVQGRKQFLELINYFTAGQWRNHIYQKLFSSIQVEDGSKSHFLTSSCFKEVSQKLPSHNDLKPSQFVANLEVTYPGNLHYLVWLGLHAMTNTNSPTDCKINKLFYTTTFKSLNFTTNNLPNYGTETLNQLDMDSFLYLTLFCSSAQFEEPKGSGVFSSDRPVVLPADVTNLLCSEDQAKWWRIAYKIATSNSKITDNEKLTNARFVLQKGLEVLRGENLSLPLTIHLARTFANRVDEEKDEIRKEGCEKRALYLWDLALLSLKCLSSKVVTSSFRSSKLFHFPVMETYSQIEITNYLDEGRYFVANYYMKCRLFEKALDMFKLVNTPGSIFKQALIYEKMASEAIECLRGDEITSELRARQAVLATKARDCLQQAKDVIRMDHPLYQEIRAKSADIDQLLCRIEPENGLADGNGFNMSEGSFSFGSEDSPQMLNNVTPAYHHSSRMAKNFPASTPKVNHDYRFASNGVDIAELLSIHQSTNQMKIQQVLDQSRVVLDQLQNITFEQKNQRSMLEDLCSKLIKLDSDLKTGLSDLKKEVKRPDLYNMLEEDDYTEDVLQYPYFPQRGLQGNNTVTYGAPMQQYFSPNQIYPGSVFGAQSAGMGFGDGPQVADYLRSLAAGPAAGGLRAAAPGMCLGLQQPPMAPIPNLAHLQVASPAQVTPSPPVKIPVAPNNVVITTSDTLPVSVPTSTPTLSVTIPPEHRLGSTSTHTPVPHKFQIPMPSDFKLVERSPVADAANEEIEATVDGSKDSETIEHDPLPNFKPIIPLPDEVEVKTGEENEIVMFDVRAKLFRFVNKEWKERGLGQLKILKNESSGRFRILMRREQVHKICANHFITDEMNLIKFTSSDKAWMWWAHDFADEKVEVEKLLAKFKTSEDADNFKKVFDQAKLLLADNKNLTPTNKVDNKASTSKNSSKGFNKNESGSSFSAAAKSSDAPKSSILSPPKFVVPADSGNQGSNTEKVTLGGFTFLSQPKLSDPDKDKVKKEEKKVESPFANFSFGVSSEPSKESSAIKPPLLGTSPLADKGISSAQEPKFGIFSKPDGQKTFPNVSTSQSEAPKPFAEMFKPQEGSWTCSDCYIQNSSSENSCVACSASRPGGGPTVWSCPDCYSENLSSSTNCLACMCPSPLSSVKPKLGATATGTSQDVSSTSFPSVVNLLKAKEGLWDCSHCSLTNDSNITKCAACNKSRPEAGEAKSNLAEMFKPETATTSSFTFGSSTFSFGVPASDQKTSTLKPATGGFTFGANQNSASTQIFTFGSSGSMTTQTATPGAKFSFTMVPPAKPADGVDQKSPQAPHGSHKSDDESGSENEDVDHTEGIFFQPVVDLPDKVEVKTGEEDEEVLYSHRAKLFRFDNHPDQKQWKERGTGDIKILKHSVTGKLRLLMRREPVMKLCLNHYITGDIELMVKDSRSWSWFALDFADGEVSRVVQHFCVRFKTPEIAQQFKEEFSKAQTLASPCKGSAPAAASAPQPVVKKPVDGVVSTAKPEDDDVEVVFESTISEELKQKALSLQLPPFFYLYQNAPKCPGCRGCEDESDTEEKPSMKGVGQEKSGFTFGSRASSLFGSTTSPRENLFVSSTNNQQTPDSSSTEKKESQPLNPVVQPSMFGGSPNFTYFGTNKEIPSPSVLMGGSLFGEKAAPPAQPVGFSFGSVPAKPKSDYQASPIFGSAASPASTSFSFGSVPPHPNSSYQTEDKPNLTAQPESTPSTKPDSKGSNLFSTSSELSFGSLAAKANTGFPATPSENTPSTKPDSKGSGLFSTSSELSFGSLAKVANTSFTSSGDFKWDGAGSTIFGSSVKNQTETPTKDNDEAEEDKDDCEKVENDDHDPHFEPIVPLPAKIELKTGEEDEEIVFSERGKLFRRDSESKEWKERGIGVMKLLRHTIHNTYRLLMRREQVHKIVCNHLVTPDLKINPMKNSETSWCWYAMNLSQDDTTPVLETLCVKFKNTELANSFKAAVDAAQKNLLDRK